MTTTVAAQATAHSSAFSANKALQNRHGKGHIQFALPASAGQTPAAPPAPQAAGQAAAQPAKQPHNPGNYVTHPLMAQIAAQNTKTLGQTS